MRRGSGPHIHVICCSRKHVPSHSIGWEHAFDVVATLLRIIYQLTEPPLRFLRRYIKPIPLGRVYFDVSFLVLYFVLVILRILI